MTPPRLSPSPPLPPHGEAVGRIEIPAIGADWIFLEGVALDVLKDGPGTTRARRSQASPATRASPATAPPTGSRSTTSISSVTATGYASPTSPAPPSSTAISAPRSWPGDVEVIQDRGDNRLDADRLPSQVQRSGTDHRERPPARRSRTAPGSSRGRAGPTSMATRHPPSRPSGRGAAVSIGWRCG